MVTCSIQFIVQRCYFFAKLPTIFPANIEKKAESLSVSEQKSTESICNPIRNQENLPIHILEKLHADSCILRSSYQKHTFSVPKTYVFHCKNVRFWNGEHKTQPAAQRNHGELNTLDMDFPKFVRLFQVIV